MLHNSYPEHFIGDDVVFMVPQTGALMPRKFKVARMEPRHLNQVHKINADAFTSPWSLNDFRDTLLQKDIVGLVSLDGDQVVGYLIYERHKHTIFLLNMACSEDYARQGAVTGLINYVKSRLKEGRQEQIETDVPENASDCIAMLRKAGFAAIGITRDQFEQEPGEILDGYIFIYSLPKETFRNRISHLLEPKERP